MSGNINARELTGARPKAGGNRYFYGSHLVNARLYVAEPVLT
jgi:hypothetical protein